MPRKNENYLRPRTPRPRSISSTMKTVIHLGLTNEKNMEILKYRNFENVENSFTVTGNLVMENSTEILNKSKNDCRSSWSSQEVVKDKDTRLLGLSIMSWENDLFKRRDKRKMVHPSGSVQDVLRSSRVLWIRWRSCWIRVENFPEQHYRSDKRSTNTYDDRTLNQNDSLSGSYPCQCSTNSVAAVEVQFSISTLRVIRDFDNGFSGNLKNIHWHVQYSHIAILCNLISWKRKGQALGLLHHKIKSARWTWRRR